MKRIHFMLMVAITMSAWGCNDHYEEITRLKTYYPMDLDQPLTIEATVVPVGDVDIQFDDMLLEVNADYYNRYGIAVDLSMGDQMDVPNDILEDTDKMFMPKTDNKVLRIFVVAEEYVKRWNNAAAYAVIYNGMPAIVLGEHVQTTRTLAHEIGHVFGLVHVDTENNVMRPMYVAKQYDVPNDFTEDQINTILECSKKRYSSLTARSGVQILCSY